MERGRFGDREGLIGCLSEGDMAAPSGLPEYVHRDSLIACREKHGVYRVGIGLLLVVIALAVYGNWWTGREFQKACRSLIAARDYMPSEMYTQNGQFGWSSWLADAVYRCENRLADNGDFESF